MESSLYNEALMSSLLEAFGPPTLENVNDVRCLVEMAYFKTLIRGIWNPRGKDVLVSAQEHTKRILNLAATEEIPKALQDQLHKEVSNLFHRLHQATCVDLKCLRSGQKLTVRIPVTALAAQSKRLIFEYLANPLLEELRELREDTESFVFADKAIRSRNTMVQDLARRLGVAAPTVRSDEIASIKGSLAEAQEHCRDLKRELEYAQESTLAERLEKRLIHAQAKSNNLSAQLQKICKTEADSGATRQGRHLGGLAAFP